MANPFIHPNLGALHLGRSAPSPRSRNMMAKKTALHNFMASLPPAPVSLDNTSGITDWGAMLNQELGDCTCAENGHAIQAWTAAAGTEVTVPDSAILTEYEQACGYNPSDPSTDQGGIISNVLDYFQNTGVGGYKISAHAQVNLTQMRVQQGVYIFGNLDFGVQLPITAQNQVGSRWSIVGDGQTGDSAPGSWGGHSICAVAYDASGVTFVTWGALQVADWDWVMLYADEAHAAVFPSYPSPVSTDQLISDLQAVGT
jgi:hypothetical protein